MLKQYIKNRLKKRNLKIVPANKLSLDLLLNTYGYFNSIEKKIPIDRDNNPIPWFTYPAIEYIKQFDLSDSRIFEWGSGNSSFFFAKRSKSIYSVEHDRNWFETNIKKIHENQKLEFYNNIKEYVNAINLYDILFDIIIIDGEKRLSCAREAVNKLSDKGLIVFDNSDWFIDGCEFLRDNGFNQIDFFGIGPINKYAWCTSIFFKNNFPFRTKSRQPIQTLGGINQLVIRDELQE